MKARHVESYRLNAVATLSMLNIAIGQDFQTLSRHQLKALEDYAKIWKIQKPKGAKKSLGHVLFDRVQKLAKPKA